MRGGPEWANWKGKPLSSLAMLTRNMASALLRNRISQLNLGWMATEAEDRIQHDYHGAPADWLENTAAGQPNGRLIDPEEAARAVAFLSCSELGLMTGLIVNFDRSVWGGAFDGAPRPKALLWK